MSSVFWFRKDLRLQDNEALAKAVHAASLTTDNTVYCVSGFNSASFEKLEGIRQHSLTESIKSLDRSLAGKLNLVRSTSGKELAQELITACSVSGSVEVYAMQVFDPELVAEQEIVGKELAAKGLVLRLSGSAYAVNPGTVAKPDGLNYRVYTPFYKAWNQLANISPIALPTLGTVWGSLTKQDISIQPTKDSPLKVIAGEEFALRTFERFKKRALDHYDEQRNRADLSGTSHLSHALAHGEIHPRTLLAALGDSDAHEVFRKEIAWREFYADVLHHYPHTLNDYYEPKFKKLKYDTGAQAQKKFELWCKGETGFPMVDAGMR